MQQLQGPGAFEGCVCPVRDVWLAAGCCPVSILLVGTGAVSGLFESSGVWGQQQERQAAAPRELAAGWDKNCYILEALGALRLWPLLLKPGARARTSVPLSLLRQACACLCAWLSCVSCVACALLALGLAGSLALPAWRVTWHVCLVHAPTALQALTERNQAGRFTEQTETVPPACSHDTAWSCVPVRSLHTFVCRRPVDVRLSSQ